MTETTAGAVHPIFSDTPSADAVLWRYMSFAKFAALMQSANLRFTRIDRFDDHFEGVWPRRDLEAWNRMSALPAGVTEAMRRNRVAASCWVNLPHESAGMWRLYAPGAEGVAVKTTFGKLLAITKTMETAAPGTVAGAAKVQYIDHATDSLLAQLRDGDAYPNAMLPFMLKHISYAHENEVRALVIAPMAPNGGFEIEPDGCGSASFTLAALVEEVVTSPLGEPWFEETVIELARAHGVTAVRRSDLHRRAFWQRAVPPS